MKAYFKKIYTVLCQGNLIETIARRNLMFELKRLYKQQYRFSSSALSRRCRKTIIKYFPDHSSIISTLNKTIGNGSRFSEFVTDQERIRILDYAELCLQHRFNILGSGEVTLDRIDWHIDFKSGFRWPPGTFYLDYVQIDLSNNADVKVPRELSRCHHFLLLGQAYLLTRDERYTEEFLRQTNSFIDENPLMRSINWGCTMDVAIRAVNWLWALVLFRESALLTHVQLIKTFTSLLEHGYFIFTNPEITHYPENRHNHYIADLTGQIYLGLLFRDVADAEHWLAQGIRSLFLEMRLQILPSGPTYERSTNYHRLVLEMFCSTIVMLKMNGHEIPADIWHRLEKMFEFVLYYTKPDGKAPIIGDQDNGRLHPFGLQDINDHRYLLTIGAVLFKRPDFKKYSNGHNPDCFFMLGPEACKHYDSIPDLTVPLQSKFFPDAGFFIMRNADNYMFINISGKGKYGEIPTGTHTHSDLLSFELAVEGRSFIVDPGTYLYSADPAARKLFRSTRMHNTVVVDNENQNIIKENELWNFERNALPRLLAWSSSDEFDYFSAEHTGYLRLNDPVLHRRTVRFKKTQRMWDIEDSIIGSGTHIIDCFFHFYSGIDFTIAGQRATTTLKHSANICLTFRADKPIKLHKESGFISNSYGQREQASVLRIEMQTDCPAFISTAIAII